MDLSEARYELVDLLDLEVKRMERDEPHATTSIREAKISRQVLMMMDLE